MEIKRVPIDELKMAAYNPRKDLQPYDKEYQKLEKSIKHFGYVDPIIWNERTGNIIGGHQRVKILASHGEKEVDVSVVNLSTEDEKALNIALNKISGDWDEEKLEEVLTDLVEIEDFDVEMIGFDETEIDDILQERPSLFRDKVDASRAGAIFDDFVIPPFSVFDTRQGYWQERKKHWINMGLKSEVGREENLCYADSLNLSDNVKGTSIFDPVICEIIYRWFNTPYGKIIDPFAGGSVRGIVAALTGHEYLGIDLREEQIQSNNENAKELGIEESKITWICDDSINIDKYAEIGGWICYSLAHLIMI